MTGPGHEDLSDGRPGRLACGTDPDVLLAQVAEGRGDLDGGERDAHQARCPHCQAALAEYTRLWAPFGRLAAAEVHAPPGLLDQALATVRETAAPPGVGQVADEDGGSYRVAARAVISVAGHAARTSAGVRMALSTIGTLGTLSTLGDTLEGMVGAVAPGDSGAPAGALTAGVSGQSVAVELTVAAEYGHDLHRLAEHLRARVADEVAAQTGLEVVEVDVTITDVFTPHPGPAAGPVGPGSG